MCFIYTCLETQLSLPMVVLPGTGRTTFFVFIVYLLLEYCICFEVTVQDCVKFRGEGNCCQTLPVSVLSIKLSINFFSTYVHLSPQSPYPFFSPYIHRLAIREDIFHKYIRGRQIQVILQEVQEWPATQITLN